MLSNVFFSLGGGGLDITDEWGQVVPVLQFPLTKMNLNILYSSSVMFTSLLHDYIDQEGIHNADDLEILLTS